MKRKVIILIMLLILAYQLPVFGEEGELFFIDDVKIHKMETNMVTFSDLEIEVTTEDVRKMSKSEVNRFVQLLILYSTMKSAFIGPPLGDEVVKKLLPKRIIMRELKKKK